jgi:hypothetical protein
MRSIVKCAELHREIEHEWFGPCTNYSIVELVRFPGELDS